MCTAIQQCALPDRWPLPPSSHSPPAQDLVMPLMKRPDHFRLSPVVGGPTRERRWLAFHRGRVRAQGATLAHLLRACCPPAARLLCACCAPAASLKAVGGEHVHFPEAHCHQVAAHLHHRCQADTEQPIATLLWSPVAKCSRGPQVLAHCMCAPCPVRRPPLQLRTVFTSCAPCPYTAQVQPESKVYSRRVRQRVAKAAKEGRWLEKYNITVGE